MYKEKIKKAYKHSENIYDKMLTHKGFFSKIYNDIFWGVDDIKVANKVLSVIPSDFSGELLDVPVGTAVFTAETYAMLPKASISCLDYSEEMLRQAEERFESFDIHNVKCICGDVGALPFSDESFDILISMNGFHAFPDKAKAFSETSRVLKRGGIFAGCFYVRGECKRSDLLVKYFLSPMGWFTPPFMSLTELSETLNSMYSKVSLKHKNSIAYFRCTK